MQSKSFIADDVYEINKSNLVNKIKEVADLSFLRCGSTNFSDTHKEWRAYNLYIKILRKCIFYEKSHINDWTFDEFCAKYRTIGCMIPYGWKKELGGISGYFTRKSCYIINREIYKDYDIIKYKR